ncbi:MAG: hypothetical protein C0601_04510 [Candidatus Muiribacterium halophilum]|uniref:Uncharacterized protein n=1 Tax=Muiribacterium halophilum TaxID=2053465 RepID=A0A2N5ZIN7_MUIH1|nr:MAG: hypothetical protein C0601_04510 [Candidatus Muirbacterium halophilum]
MNERDIVFIDQNGKKRIISVDIVEKYLDFKKNMIKQRDKGFFNKIKKHGRTKLRILNSLLENNSKDLFNRNVFQ